MRVRPRSAGEGWQVVFVVGIDSQALEGQVQEMAVPTDPDHGQGQDAHQGDPALARGDQIDEQGHDQEANDKE